MFCIPAHREHLKDLYENHIEINFNSPGEDGVEKGQKSVTPKFTPTILDIGVSDGSGEDTQLSFCFKLLNNSSKFRFHINLDHFLSSNDSKNESQPFLLVSISLSEDPYVKYEEWQRSVELTLKEASEECIQYSVHRLQYHKTKILDKDHELCEEPRPQQKDYNQAYCLDICFQNFLADEWFSGNSTDKR